jgi:hypothetical protein
MNLAHEIASVNAIALILGSVPTRRQSNEFQKDRIIDLPRFSRQERARTVISRYVISCRLTGIEYSVNSAATKEKHNWRFKMKLRMLIVVFVVLSALPVVFSAGDLPTHVPLPADLQGELDGVPYRILVPENWPDPSVFSRRNQNLILTSRRNPGRGDHINRALTALSSESCRGLFGCQLLSAL